ncbi:hypothetical protein WDU94_009886, partial [Cyamophila willieti]
MAASPGHHLSVEAVRRISRSASIREVTNTNVENELPPPIDEITASGVDPGTVDNNGQRRLRRRRDVRRAQPESEIGGDNAPSDTSSTENSRPLEARATRRTETRRRAWTREDNVEILKAFYISNNGEDVSIQGFMTRMHQQWSIMRPDFPRTATQLNNQRNTILRRNWFTREEINLIKASCNQMATNQTQEENLEPNNRTQHEENEPTEDDRNEEQPQEEEN